jgi:purine-binding chemotaxis protein CheW
MDQNNNVTKFQKKGAAVNLNRYLEFCLGAEEYAIPLLMVREVISVPETTPIPKSPAHFLGIMNLRGQVISVVDMRKKLKIEAKADVEEAVIIVDIGGLNIGVVVDSINKVLAIAEDEVCEMPEVEHQINTQYIHGVFKKEHSLTVLLDIAKVLDIQDLQMINSNKEAA